MNGFRIFNAMLRQGCGHANMNLCCRYEVGTNEHIVVTLYLFHTEIPSYTLKLVSGKVLADEPKNTGSMPATMLGVDAKKENALL